MNKVYFNTEEVPPPEWTKAAGAFVGKVLETLNLDGWELSVLFCDNRYIKTLNAQYRNKDEATDVLSFEAGETVPGGNGLPGRKGRKLAGDIVVSLEALKENTRFFKVSEDEELRRLLVHGALHLFGHDHATNNTGEPMLKIQEEILARLESEKIISPLSRAADTEKAK